jgi:hypothetical protein
MICAYASLTLQSPQVFSQQQSEGAKICSIFEAVETNCIAWRQGDVLIRRSNFVDTAENPDFEGRLEDIEVWTRIVFDFDAQRFTELNFAVFKRNWINPEMDNSKDDLIVEFRGQSYDKSRGFDASVYKGDRTQGRFVFKEENIPNDATKHDLPISMKFTDFRWFWFDRSNDLDLVKNSLNSCKLGLGYSSHKLSNGRLTIRLAPPEAELKEKGGVVTTLVFDTDKLLFLASRSISKLPGQPDAIAEEFDLKWRPVKGVFVPVESRELKGKAFFEKGEMSEIGTEITTYHFHWFSVNEQLDDELFNVENLREPNWITNMLDPIRLEAESLKRFRQRREVLK